MLCTAMKMSQIVIPCDKSFPLVSVLVFKWVRRTLIALVQVTFGRTINK